MEAASISWGEVAGLVVFLIVAVLAFRFVERVIEPEHDLYDDDYVPPPQRAHPSEQTRARIYDEAADTLPATRAVSGVTVRKSPSAMRRAS